MAAAGVKLRHVRASVVSRQPQVAWFTRQFRHADVRERGCVVAGGASQPVVVRDDGAFGVHLVRDGRGVVVAAQIVQDWLDMVYLEVEVMFLA